MKKTLENLRSKKQHEKERFAFMGAFIITAFIVLFWLLGISVFQRADNSQAANTITPFESLKMQFGQFKSNIKK